MRDGGNVLDHSYLEAHGLQSADGGLSSGAGALYEDLNGLQAMLHSGLSGGLGGSLSGTGDIMTSVICAAAAKGESIPDAAARAAHFITRVLEGSPDISNRNYGIPFQPYLSELSATE